MIEFEYREKIKTIDKEENPEAFEAICKILEINPNYVYDSISVKMEFGFYYDNLNEEELL